MKQNMFTFLFSSSSESSLLLPELSKSLNSMGTGNCGSPTMEPDLSMAGLGNIDNEIMSSASLLELLQPAPDWIGLTTATKLDGLTFFPPNIFG
jgi:hypothetical protein